MDSTLTLRHAAFKVGGDNGRANVILSLSLAHAISSALYAHVRKTTSAQLQPRIAIVADWQAQYSATWVVHYTQRMQELMDKIYFRLLLSSTETKFEFNSNLATLVRI